MSYTGHVVSGGPPDIRTLPGLTIIKQSVGPMDNNCYLLRCGTTGQQLLVDAANDADRLLALVGPAGIATVVTTHQHWDHVQALGAVVAATGATTVAHPDDATAIPGTTARLVRDGDTVQVGDVVLDVIHLVGHTPGSIALLHHSPAAGTHLFTGDSLFPGGPGNTQQDPARFTSLLDDLEHKVFDRLPDDTWVYPGHGGDTTLGTERPSLGEWRSRGW